MFRPYMGLTWNEQGLAHLQRLILTFRNQLVCLLHLLRLPWPLDYETVTLENVERGSSNCVTPGKAFAEISSSQLVKSYLSSVVVLNISLHAVQVRKRWKVAAEMKLWSHYLFEKNSSSSRCSFCMRLKISQCFSRVRAWLPYCVYTENM